MGRRSYGLALVAAMVCAAATGSHATAAPGGTPEQRISTPGSRVEPSVAVDPRDPRHVTVAAIDLRHQQLQATVLTGYDPYDVVFVSDDGGHSYRPGAPFPTVDMAQQSANDPTLYWAPDSTLYAGYLSFGPIGAPVGPETGDGVWLARSSDGGRHWSRGITLEHYAGSGPCAGPDKPMVVGDPRRPQRVFVVYVYLGNMCSGDPPMTHEIRYVGSDDGGRTWSRPRGVGDGFGPSARVAADGSLVIAYVGNGGAADTATTAACGDLYASTLVAAVLPNGSVRHSVAVLASCVDAAGRFGYNGTFSTVSNVPSLEVDRRTGAFVVAVGSNGVSPGVVVARSSDGTRWSQQTLADLPDELMAMPQLAGGPGGALGLLYLASGPAGTYTATLRASTDGGLTWGAGTALASVPSTGDLRPLTQYSAYSVGHYLGLAIGSDGVAQAAWPDVRPDPAQPGEPDIWTRGLPVGR